MSQEVAPEKATPEEVTTEQKAVINLTIKRDKHDFVFSMPVGATYQDAYEAAYATLKSILDMSKNVATKAQEEAGKATAAAAEAKNAVDGAQKAVDEMKKSVNGVDKKEEEN